MPPFVTDLRSLRSRLPEEFLSRFDLGPELGRGGQGVAVRAQQKALRRDVVLKFLHVADTVAAERFVREGQALAELRHPNVVRVYDSGCFGEVLYLVLEFLDGEPLSWLILEDRLDLDQVLKITRDVLSGLEAVHEAGMVHRDLKPANIMILPDLTAKLIDFGVAHASRSQALTADGSFVGTPSYASPEQLSGEGVDARTDLYSLGVVLHEALTGVNPFVSTEVREVLYRQVQKVVRSVEGSRFPPHPALEKLVVSLLSKQPELRPQSARDAKARLDFAPAPVPVPVTEVLAPPPAGTVELPAPGPSRTMPVPYPVLLVCLAIGVMFVAFMVRDRRAEEPVTALPTPVASPAALSWDPEEGRRLIAGAIDRWLARRGQRVAIVGSPGAWEYGEANNVLDQKVRLMELVKDFKNVEEFLRKAESEDTDGTLAAHASCVLAALQGLRYMHWADLIGESQLSQLPLVEKSRGEDSDFLRQVTRVQDSRSLFYLRKATQGLERALADCLREGTVPLSFVDLPRMAFEVSWFAEGFTWSDEVKPSRDEEYRRLDAALSAMNGGDGELAGIVELVRLSSLDGRSRAIQGSPRAAPFAEIRDRLIAIGRLPAEMRDRPIGGYVTTVTRVAPGSDAATATHVIDDVEAGRARRLAATLGYLDAPYRVGYDRELDLEIRSSWIEMIVDFERVEKVLAGRGAGPDGVEGIVESARLLTCRYTLWSELVGARQTTLEATDPDYPREDLADFYRAMPREQDARALFHLRSALKQLHAAVDACLAAPRIPESFGKVLVALHQVYRSASWVPWKEATRSLQEEDLSRFEKDLAGTPGGASSRVRELLVRAIGHARASTTEDVAEPRREFDRLLGQLIQEGALPGAMRQISLPALVR